MLFALTGRNLTLQDGSTGNFQGTHFLQVTPYKSCVIYLAIQREKRTNSESKSNYAFRFLNIHYFYLLFFWVTVMRTLITDQNNITKCLPKFKLYKCFFIQQLCLLKHISVFSLPFLEIKKKRKTPASQYCAFNTEYNIGANITLKP